MDSSSTSSTDCEDSRPLAKKQKLKTTRGMSKLIAPALVASTLQSENNAIYTNRVALMWNKLPAHGNGLCDLTSPDSNKLPSCMRNKGRGEFTQKNPSKQSRKTGTKKTKSLDALCRSIGLRDVSDVTSNDLSIIADTISGDDSVVQSSKDPTPPSSPSVATRKRAKRVPKAVKTAMTKLQKAQQFLCTNEDDEVIFVETAAPMKSPTKERKICVKIKSRSGVHRHEMKLTDSFTDVMKLMSNIENVNQDDIIMFVNDKTIHPYDSPKSLGLTVADIIDCHIRSATVTPSSDDDDSTDSLADPMVLRLVLQSTQQPDKSRVTLTIRRNEPMEKIMREFARIRQTEYNLLTFMFDGERIEPTSTPDDLDLETDFCIDVITMLIHDVS